MSVSLANRVTHVRRGRGRSRARKMVGQLTGAVSINYSGDVAKAINFIGRRPGYGSSVPVTVALLQRPILCPVFLDHVPARLTPY